MKGFSLLELIIAVSILGVITAVGVNTFHNAIAKKEQEGIVQTIVSHLEKQKADTQAGKDGLRYGIKFNNSSYVLYQGDSYVSSASSNQQIQIDPDFTLTETVTNGNNAIFFYRIYGEANETATITIAHIYNRVPPKSIIVNDSGSISVSN